MSPSQEGWKFLLALQSTKRPDNGNTCPRTGKAVGNATPSPRRPQRSETKGGHLPHTRFLPQGLTSRLASGATTRKCVLPARTQPARTSRSSPSRPSRPEFWCAPASRLHCHLIPPRRSHGPATSAPAAWSWAAPPAGAPSRRPPRVSPRPSTH